MMTPSPTQKAALILGATGGFGGAVTLALLKRGWTIRALARNPDAARARLGERLPIEWIKGDALDAGAVAAAARGAQVIVHAVNPPRYRNWKGLVMPMTMNTIAAAKAEGATILAPGNVYNYAPDAGPAIAEDAAQRPATRKGAIRVEMEEALRKASTQGARVLILRAGDFFGPGADNGGALGWTTVRSKGRVSAILSPGRPGVGHAFAYLPDLGEAAARLLERREGMAPYETVHFRGQWASTGALAEAIRRAEGRRVPVLPFPWVLTTVMGPFDETLRELGEMRYLWRRPIGLANDRLVQLIGEEPHTPFERAVAAALDDLRTAEAPAPTIPAAKAEPVLASAR